MEGRRKKHLADEIRQRVLILGERDGVFPNAWVSTFIGKAGGLELGPCPSVELDTDQG